MELIDVDVAMNAFLDECMDEYGKYFSCHDIDRVLDTVPKVDAAPVVHGQWLSAYEYGLKLGITDAEALEGLKKDKWWKFCEDCGEGVKGNHNYCPNCGAKMDGGVEDG